MVNDEIARMKQVENYKSKYMPRSFSETKDSPDSYWKYQQKRSQSFPVGRNSRNPEAVASYYSSSTTYKPQRSHVCSSPTHSKCTSLHSPELIHHVTQGHCKPTRDKHYPSSFSPTRKTHYDDELGDNEKLKYINEESENFTEDNAEEDAEEEEEEHEEAAEFLDKDYEGQEGDDETEEEFLTSQQTHRGQRVSKKDALLKQRWRSIDQEPRRFRCQQHVDLALAGHASSPRYYHNAAEHEISEPLSDEEFVLTSLKSPTRRSPADYHQWPQNKSDRYDDNSIPIQSPRRARTKPNMDQLIESEYRRTRRCNRCGNLSNRKNELLSKNGCRYDDRTNSPTKGPIGDEPETHEQMFCGRCNLRHNAKDTTDTLSPLYSTKSRKSRDSKSPTAYDVPEQGQMDKLSNEYSRYSSRYQRKAAEAYHEKLKRVLQGTARVSPRYVD
ncbi:uncharacterized protein LOC117604804 isoform X1 [Osmia lignaria lignaria]|uniref:uncharacterized protein LOC117604804 isoform X1 n=1 Tax=Osmia lignaria lignaria TaxID=1437193 RepID=UPI00402B1F93